MGNPNWTQIPSCPFYEASDTGQVRRVAGYGGKGRRAVPRNLAPIKDKDGYLKVTLHLGGLDKRREGRVHQLIAEAFIGPRPLGFVVNHKNGIKDDNRPCNLEWASTYDNEAHAVANGLKVRGNRQHASKLTEGKVRNIRILLQNGMRQADIARRFSLCQATVSEIHRKRIWGWLNG